MEPGILLAAVLVVLGFARSANADPVLLVNGSGILTGAQNVNVGGTLYDVRFVEGTCIEVFGGCDAGSDFTFATFEDAAVAANALLGQVFVGKFDRHPELTLGCTDPSQCFPAIPAEITPAGLVVSGAVAYNSAVDKLLTNFNFLTDYDTRTDKQAVWVEFTAAQPVPEPSSLVLVGSGLVVVMRRAAFSWSTRRARAPRRTSTL